MDINVSKINETFVNIKCSESIAEELYEFFEFYAPGYKHHPLYKKKKWNGKIHLFNKKTYNIYTGLIPYIKKFAEDRNYTISVYTESSNNFSEIEADNFIKSLNLPKHLEVRDYQKNAFIKGIRNKRHVFISATSSGKSLIIYLITRYLSKKTLIIVPTTALVGQMCNDFIEYDSVSNNIPNVHVIYEGQPKNGDADIYISTWQSIYDLPQEYFNQFDVIIGDEAHTFKATSLKSIMEKSSRTEYRFGFTGTLSGAEVHQLMLEGLFGIVRNVITSKELIDSNFASNIIIKCINLVHKFKDNKVINKKLTYQQEMKYLTQCNSRNEFIKNLAISLSGNTLILFQYVDNHGKVIFNNIKNSISKDRQIFFVFGETEMEFRNQIRNIVEKENNAIIVASYPTFSTGINIKRLNNIIFASPSKSRIRILQSIGRAMRLAEDKNSAIIFDISDDLSKITNNQNITLSHFIERIKIYIQESLNHKLYTVELNN